MTDLSPIPIYDHSAGVLLREEVWREEPLERYFSLSTASQVQRFVPDTLAFRRSLRDLAEFYGCEASLEGVLQARRNQNHAELCRFFFAESNLQYVLLEEASQPDTQWMLSECEAVLPCKVRRVVALETELAKLVEHYDTATKLLQAFESQLRSLAPMVAAFKTHLSSYTGLEVVRHNLVEVERSYADMRRQQIMGEGKLSSKPLLDAMLWMALRVAVETERPVQIHCGYGPHLDLRQANPLQLHTLLEAPEFGRLNAVLLGIAPYMREASYLALQHKGIYLDLSLKPYHFGVQAMANSVLEALQLAPLSKLLFSTGASRSPELFYLASRWGRRMLAQGLEQCVQNGDLLGSEVEWAAERILNVNAIRLYGVLENSLLKTTTELVQE